MPRQRGHYYDLPQMQGVTRFACSPTFRELNRDFIQFQHDDLLIAQAAWVREVRVGVSKSGCTPSELVSPSRDDALAGTPTRDEHHTQYGIEKADVKSSQRRWKITALVNRIALEPWTKT